MSIYLEASTLSMVLLRDVGCDALEAWLRTTTTAVLFSDFGWGEFVSAVSLRVRVGAVDARAAVRSIELARDAIARWGLVETNSADIRAATKLVEQFELKLKLPDAIHLAAARRLQCVLVTADARQAAAAAAIGLAFFNPLLEVPSP